MNAKPHSHPIGADKARAETSLRVNESTRAEPPRVAASLDAWLARDWSEGIHLARLEELQQLHICTQNTLYEVVVINHCGDVRVRGGRYFPDWTAARLAGSTAGGSCLKRLGVNLGLQMEFEVDRRRIVTSPVRSIAVLSPTSQ